MTSCNKVNTPKGEGYASFKSNSIAIEALNKAIETAKQLMPVDVKVNQQLEAIARNF
jgi:hypothetical protein